MPAQDSCRLERKEQSIRAGIVQASGVEATTVALHTTQSRLCMIYLQFFYIKPHCSSLVRQQIPHITPITRQYSFLNLFLGKPLVVLEK